MAPIPLVAGTVGRGAAMRAAGGRMAAGCTHFIAKRIRPDDDQAAEVKPPAAEPPEDIDRCSS